MFLSTHIPASLLTPNVLCQLQAAKAAPVLQLLTALLSGPRALPCLEGWAGNDPIFGEVLTEICAILQPHLGHPALAPEVVVGHVGGFEIRLHLTEHFPQLHDAQGLLQSTQQGQCTDTNQPCSAAQPNITAKCQMSVITAAKYQIAQAAAQSTSCRH